MIRWITHHIGTAPWEQANRIPDVEMLDVRDLVDGAGNPVKLAEEKINAGVAILREKKRLVVCCEFGMSRSNAIAVGILCRMENISFDQGLRLVIDATKEAQIKLSVLKTVKKILNEGEASKRKKAEKVLIIDYEGVIGKELSSHLGRVSALVLDKSADFSGLLGNPALLYLLLEENSIHRIVFIGCAEVINTNEFVGKLLFFLKNVLDTCKEAECGLLFLSTLDVFSGYGKKTVTVKPGSAKRPSGNRGIAYSLAEELLAVYKKESRLEAAVVRIPTVYGAQETKPYFIANFIRKAQSGAEINIHKYRNNLAWVNIIHVNDLVRFISRLLKKRFFGIFNIDSGEELNTLDMVKQIVGIYSSSSKISVIDLENDHPKIKVGLGRIKGELGWRPREKFQLIIKKQKHANSAN
jgi:nucleoside-diphosphate-sugar epimerase